MGVTLDSVTDLQLRRKSDHHGEDYIETTSSHYNSHDRRWNNKSIYLLHIIHYSYLFITM